MYMDLLAKAKEIPTLVESLEPSVALHRLLMRLRNQRILMSSPDTQVTARRSVPPEHQAMIVVGPEIDMQIEGHIAAHVVVVERSSTATEDIFHGPPHQLEAPVFV